MALSAATSRPHVRTPYRVRVPRVKLLKFGRLAARSPGTDGLGQLAFRRVTRLGIRFGHGSTSGVVLVVLLPIVARENQQHLVHLMQRDGCRVFGPAGDDGASGAS